MYPSSLWQRAQWRSYGMFWWMDHLTAVAHPQQSKFRRVFLMNMFLFNTLLCIAYSRSDDSADGSTGYHRLTADSMLMKPGFLRSSQYVLLETHLSLCLVSTTFLKEKGHISVFCPALFLITWTNSVHSAVMLWCILSEFKSWRCYKEAALLQFI